MQKKDSHYGFTLSCTGRESSRAHYWPKKIKSSTLSLIQSLLIIMFSPFYVCKIISATHFLHFLGFCTKKEKKNSGQANKVNKWMKTPLILLWAVCVGQHERTFFHSRSGHVTVACQVMEKICGVSHNLRHILQTI